MLLRLNQLKVKLSYYLTKHYAMKTYGGVDVWIHVFLASALVGGESLASRPSHFNPVKRRLVGSQRLSTRYGEVNILNPLGLELQPLSRIARSQSLYRLSHSVP
jgi:hypothetical protein